MLGVEFSASKRSATRDLTLSSSPLLHKQVPAQLLVSLPVRCVMSRATLPHCSSFAA